jgi:putative flavoprotein involved in K+ transport
VNTPHYEVVVIGSGQAGLAIGYHLARQGRRFTILDAASAPAAAWRARWDSLRLFTPARYDGLPGLPFPGDPAHHPSRDEVVAYLTGYARHFQLPVQLNRRVLALRAAGGGYAVELADHQLHADQVVVATGPFQTPRIPALAGGLDIPHRHSADYRSPADLPDGRVLVVGGGNTGFQLAEELAASHEVHLAVGTRQTPLPQRLLGRDVFDLLHYSGLIRVSGRSPLGRRLRQRDVLIGCGPRSARRAGITLHPRAISASGATTRFADDTAVDVDAVLWATGFARDHTWIDAPVFAADGAIAHDRGVTASPGLHVLGLSWLHTRGSALLGWVGDDAAHLAARVAENS